MAGLPSALRVTGGALLGAGILAAGAAAGALAERQLVKSRIPDDGPVIPYWSLAGREVVVIADDGTPLFAEIDEPTNPAHGNVTVVLTHGFALNRHSWHYQRLALRNCARVVVWDQRGHGDSGRGEAPDGVDQLGRDLAAVVQATAPNGPVVLIGHSLGGMTIMAYAEHDPTQFGSAASGAHVAGISFISTSPGGAGGEEFGLPMMGRQSAAVAPAVAKMLTKQRGLVEAVRRRSTDLSLLLARQYGFGSEVPRSTLEFLNSMIAKMPIDTVADFLPVLKSHNKVAALKHLEGVDIEIIVGDHDDLTPMHHSEVLHAHTPGSRLTVVPHSGHMAILEWPEDINSILMEQVQRVRAQYPTRVKKR